MAEGWCHEEGGLGVGCAVDVGGVVGGGGGEDPARWMGQDLQDDLGGERGSFGGRGGEGFDEGDVGVVGGPGWLSVCGGR